MERNNEVITFFSTNLYLKKPGLAIFAHFIKILTMFIKTILEVSRNFRRNRNYVSKRNFLDIEKFADFRQKRLISAELKRCVT